MAPSSTSPNLEGPPDLSAMPSARQVPAAESGRTQQRLFQAVMSSREVSVARTEIVQAAFASCDPSVVLYRDNNAAGPGTGHWQPLVGVITALPHPYRAKLDEWGRSACDRGYLETHELPGAGAVVLIAPVLLPGQTPDILSAIFPRAENATDRAAHALEMAAAHLALWQLLHDLLSTDSEVVNASALLEVLAKAQSSRDLKHACHILTSQLHNFMGCERIAIGFCNHGMDDTGQTGPVRLFSVSHLAKFDKHSAPTEMIEAALDEAVMKGDLTVWPPSPETQRHASLAHRKLCMVANAQSVVSSPLRDEQGRSIGAWLFLGRRGFIEKQGNLARVRAFERPVASCLQLLKHCQPGYLTRLVRRLLQHRRSWQGKLTLLTASVLIAASFLPASYKIQCDCRLEPVTRRFVVAPYHGRLEQTLVEPGDIVAEGDVVACMDGRELRLELAGLDAELNRAVKRRDAAMAIHNVVGAQQAKLEMERLELKIRLLQSRNDHLDIRSPINGMVISGDLKTVEGAPLSVGQGLFEIAPLDQMNVELNIPEEEIAHARKGMPVVFRVDAYPGRQWDGTLSRIFPRSEIHDQRSVYVAKVEFDNSSGLFRPGMSGQAKIIGAKHALAWNLFHKCYESLAMSIGW